MKGSLQAKEENLLHFYWSKENFMTFLMAAKPGHFFCDWKLKFHVRGGVLAMKKKEGPFGINI